MITPQAVDDLPLGVCSVQHSALPFTRKISAMAHHTCLVIVALCLTHGLLTSVGLAEDEPVQLKIGDEAPSWVDLVGTNDEKHSLADLTDKQVVVVCFTCNSCPYSVDYEDRMIEFHKKYVKRKEGVALIAINASLKPAERLEKMKERAKAKEFPFPYLLDETQKVAASYGANFTPEFFVLNKDRRIVYMGAMDDQTRADDVKQRFVELAVEAALKNELPATTTNPARGCSIPYKRVRR